ncbi:MAG TPA: hypothetical protein VNP95_06140 [Thermomicrobiales bacterium]|nr:hypothetical protein [Thermomicrobiales bacterium]
MLKQDLEDLRAAAIARARFLANPSAALLDEGQQATLAALDGELDRYANEVLRAASDVERHPTERAILYALVSTMRTMGASPHSPRVESTVNAQYVAARRKLRMLRRKRALALQEPA